VNPHPKPKKHTTKKKLSEDIGIKYIVTLAGMNGLKRIQFLLEIVLINMMFMNVNIVE